VSEYAWFDQFSPWYFFFYCSCSAGGGFRLFASADDSSQNTLKHFELPPAPTPPFARFLTRARCSSQVKDAGRDVRQKEAEERRLEATIAGVEWEAHTRVEAETDEFGLEPFGTKSGTVVIGRLIGRKGMDFERSERHRIL
jgi:hypothetical protein